MLSSSRPELAARLIAARLIGALLIAALLTAPGAARSTERVQEPPPAEPAADEPAGEPPSGSAAPVSIELVPVPEEEDDDGAEDDADEPEEAPLPSLDEAEPFDWTWPSVWGVLSGSKTFLGREGTLQFRLGAALQLDATTGSADGAIESFVGPVEDSIDARRIRLSSHGRVQNLNFMVSADLGTDSGLKDLWFEGRQGGLSLYETLLGKFRFGQMREPFGFEAQTSHSLLGHLERSLPAQTFDIGRNFGAMVHDVSEDGRVHWSAGTFSLGSTSEDNEDRSVFSLTGRVTGLPVDDGEGTRLVHVGGSVSSRNPAGATRFFSRPEARFVAPYADTGDIDASQILYLGAELAAVYDSLWLQAEAIQTSLTAPQADDPVFYGTSVSLGWFLTGESRPYRRNGGVFDRFRPELEQEHESWQFGERLIQGAWELVGRVSTIDLNDGRIRGGELTNLTAGLNWYPHESTRIQLNYVHSMRADVGDADLFLIRLQFAPW